MTLFLRHVAVATCLWTAAASAQAEPAGPTPFQNGEELHYEVAWPSGLALGEATMSAHASAEGWTFEYTLSASLPNFEIRDVYRSKTDWDLCSLEFSKEANHGRRTAREQVVFDQRNGRARRETLGGGGVSEFAVPPCARDALAFLYYLRQDLARGRVPPPDDVNWGSQYSVSVTYAESRSLEAAGKLYQADRILVDLAGPASQHSFEIFFSKDDARIPLLIRVKFDLGVFSLKLVE